MLTLALLFPLLLADESALREAFSREISSEAVEKRLAAVRSLSGATESKTVALLAGSLKDAAKEVRLAAAAAIEASTDLRGVAIAPLGEILIDKKADVDLRLACAKALAKAKYREAPFKYFLGTMSGIASEDRHLHAFGGQVTDLFDGFMGKSFGRDKLTCERWNDWWSDNQEAVKKADAMRRAEYADKP